MSGLKSFAALLLSALLFLSVPFAYGFVWSESTHDVLEADINGDGYEDILLRAKRVATPVSIPYSIDVSVNLLPDGITDIILYGQADGTYAIDYNPLAALVGDGQWNPAGWSAMSDAPVYGDYDGDGRNDIAISPSGSGGAVVVLLARQDAGHPVLKQAEMADNNPGAGSIPARGSVSANPNGLVLSAGQYVGRVSGNFAVTANGKPSYSIPLSTLPSVAGVAPELALSYNGTNGNGEIGAGWSLSGINVIARCPTQLAREGYINGVNFNNADKYCLNGQPLLLLSGTYGANGAEYRTENESFTKIVSYGTSAKGPSYFKVWKKSGEIEFYGNTTDSRLERQADASAHSWYINRIEDREGNYATFQYSTTKVPGSFSACFAQEPGEHLLCRISFTGNGSVAPKDSVRFEYESRTDILRHNSEGLARTTAKRLKHVKSYLGSVLVRRYTASYEYGIESGVSRLTKIEDCLVDNYCTKPTQFIWKDSADPVRFTEAETDSESVAGPYVNPQYHLADVNADGRADLIFTYRSNNTLGRVLYIADADGRNFHRVAHQTDTGYYANTIAEADQQVITGDFNGDGRTDLVWVGRKDSSVYRTLYLARTDGAGFDSQGYQVDTSADYNYYEEARYIPADVNGDGRTDLVWLYYADNTLGVAVYQAIANGGKVGLARTSLLKDTDFSPNYYKSNNFVPGDINGDGKTDLVWTFWFNNELARVTYLANANGSGYQKLSFETESGLFNYSSIEDLQSQLGDVNGDNRADLVVTWRTGTNLSKRLYLATAGGTDFDFASAHASSPSGINDALFKTSQAYLNDINSDGRADLLYTYTYNSTFGWVSYLANTQGNGFVGGQSGSISKSSTPVQYQQYLLGDVSADGKADIVWATVEGSNNSLAHTTLLLPQTYPDHIATITDGFGNQTELTYQYLTDTANGSIYTRGTSATYPTRDDNGLSYVVSKVDQSDGIGGFRSYSYKYEAAQTDLSGRGFLGFKKRIVTDHTTGLVTTETYNQAYPLTGTEQSIVIVDGSGNPFETTYNHWKYDTYGTAPNRRYYVKQADTLSAKYNPGTSQTLFAALTANTFEPVYGNITKEVKWVGESFSATYDPNGQFTASNILALEKTQTTDYTYDNNPTDWRIGFVTSQTITVAKPGETTRSATNSYVPRSATSFLKASESLFDGSDVEQATTYVSRDSWGNPTRIETVGRDFDGSNTATRVTTYGPYADGLYPQWQRNTLGHQTSFQYNIKVGKVSQSTDVNGLIVDTLYDDFGRSVYSKAADGTDTTSTFSYTTTGCPSGTAYTVLTRTTRGGVQGKPDSLECYDAFDRVVQSRTQDFAGNWVYTDTLYDKLGRIQQTSAPHYSGETPTFTSFSYDLIGRVTQEQKPNGGVVTSAFAPGGTGVITHTVTDSILDPVNGNRSTTTIKHLNALNLVVKAIDDHGTPTDFIYDAWDNLRWVQVNGDADTTIQVNYNDAGFKTQLTDPDAGIIQYQYDSFGNTRREIHNPGAGQEIITSEYDVLDRLTNRFDTVAGNTSQSGAWSYDTQANGIGLPATMSGADVLEEYFYDGLSRTAEKRVTLFGTTPRSFHYRYDSMSRLQRVAYPGELTLQNAYNGIGYLASVTNLHDNKVVWQANSGDKWGNITQYTLGNNLITQRSYHPQSGLIQAIKAGTTPTNGSVQNNSYTFDTSGDLVQRSFFAGVPLTEKFTYDGLNRVHTATTTGLTSGTRILNYDYDSLGNITFKTNVSDANGYKYEKTGNAGPHAVTKTVLGSTTTSYGYDAKGNMTANGAKTLQYTIFNKPHNIVDPVANSAVDFKYGPDRRRFYQRKVEAGKVTETLYFDRGNYEIVKQGSAIRQKAYVGDYLVYQSLLAGNDIKTNATSVGEKYTYLHRDNLGSTDAVTDGSGALVTRNLFDPFGLRRDVDGKNATPAYLVSLAAGTFDTTSRGYTGHEQLDSVGLVHMNGRVYDPTLGRFLSPDPAVQYPHFSQSYNRYTYVLNNPLSYNDPSGEIIPVLVWGAVAAWRAYSAYDTITTTIDNYDTVTDPNASSLDKGLAVLDTASSIVLPKPLREAVKRAGGPTVKAAAGKLANLEKKVESKLGSKSSAVPNKNQPDAATTAKVKGGAGCNCCFVAGTLVLTNEGYKAIDQLQIGDLVASKDEETGEIAWKPVTQTFVFDDDRITWLLRINTTDGAEQTFEVTDNHPFWVNEKGWIEVKDLQPGMVLNSYDSTELTVVELEMLDRSPVTYNVEVDDFHSYFAGEQRVWVHNCTCGVSTTTVVDPDSAGPVYKANVKQSVDTSKLPESKAEIPNAPISVDDALEKASSFLKDGVPVRSVDGNAGVQFIQKYTENGQEITKRVGFDLDSNSSHVKQFGPHLNLQTQIDGKIQKGALADPHIPIDPATIRPGDY